MGAEGEDRSRLMQCSDSGYDAWLEVNGGEIQNSFASFSFRYYGLCSDPLQQTRLGHTCTALWREYWCNICTDVLNAMSKSVQQSVNTAFWLLLRTQKKPYQITQFYETECSLLMYCVSSVKLFCIFLLCHQKKSYNEVCWGCLHLPKTSPQNTAPRGHLQSKAIRAPTSNIYIIHIHKSMTYS